MFLLFVLAYAELQITVSAQCTTCSIIEGCYECTQGPEGGTSCFTTACFRCRTTGFCGPLAAKTTAICGQLAAKSILPNGRLKVDRDTVREIATRSPHLAAILSDLGKEETLKETYTFYLANVQLNAEDVESWLNPNDQSSDSFVKLKKEAKRLGSKPSLLYDVSLQADPDSPLGTLIIQLRNSSASDSSGSLLHVTLIEDTRKASLDKREWAILSWKVSSSYQRLLMANIR